MIEETMNGQAQPEIQAPQQNSVQSEMERKIRGLMVDTFNTASGKALLDAWDDVYIRQVTWQPNVPKGYAEYRAGQNNIVLTVRAVVNEETKKASL